MLNQALDIFKRMYEEHGNELITDSYIPSDGEYIVVEEIDNELKELCRVKVKMDKKTRTIDRVQDEFAFIAKADYMSKLIDMNKPIDGKKVIHSNNYLSFMIKKDSLVPDNKTGEIKLTHEIVNNYYDILSNPIKKYEKSKKAKELYTLVEEKNGKVDLERLNKIKLWIKNNIFLLVDKDSTDKGYLKIFFKYELDEYRKESEKYLIPNVYNNTDFNVTIGDTVYGLPNDNMGLNAKKPYLENKTRKNKVPYLISEKEVLLQNKFFDYLMNQVAIGKSNIYINEETIIPKANNQLLEQNFTGIYLRIKKGKEVEIHDIDTVTSYNPKIYNFSFENVLDTDINVLKQQYGKISSLTSVQNLINEVFFSKFLISNYFTDAKDISLNDSNIKRNLLLARNSLFTWFYKGSKISVWQSLDRASLSIVKGSIDNGYNIKAVEQFNLRVSLQQYFEGGEKMADVLQSVKESLRNKISEKNTGAIENDMEYFFAVGQIANFFIAKSKGKKKPQSLINPIINVRSDERLKEQLSRLYKKYNYDIDNSSRRFNNMFALIKSYEPEGKINEDLIIAGYLHSSLIYEITNKEGV
ncbi:MAG: type I-B CRISPR-associated protein Cas8b/Csh1 [Clostridium sp.]|uniref:type I-B CRISPR-associated protein Cas8b/Csh1 n=1 Tax=Clostridium sp. TaxID=1506 RepID=UPI00303EC92D